MPRPAWVLDPRRTTFRAGTRCLRRSWSVLLSGNGRTSKRLPSRSVRRLRVSWVVRWLWLCATAPRRTGSSPCLGTHYWWNPPTTPACASRWPHRSAGQRLVHELAAPRRLLRSRLPHARDRQLLDRPGFAPVGHPGSALRPDRGARLAAGVPGRSSRPLLTEINAALALGSVVFRNHRGGLLHGGGREPAVHPAPR